MSTEYQECIKICRNIENETGNQILTVISNEEHIIDLDKCKDNSVVISDNYILENQKVIQEYLTFVDLGHRLLDISSDIN
jgi:hypothetical protein